MTNHSDSEIATELIGYHRMALDRDNVLRRQGAEWAPATLIDLAYDDPARCWRIIKLAALQNPDNEALMFFGVTLSGLLRENSELIKAIACDVEQDHRLREVMSWIMKDDEIDRSVWARVVSLSGPTK